MQFAPGTFLWFALFLAIGVAGTWLARGYAMRRRLLDQPGERRSHQVATPRGGGIAIVAALLIAMVAMILRQPGEIVLLVCAALALLLVAGIGWLDDHRPLSPWSRLAVHVLAAAWLMTGFYLSGRSGALALTVFVMALGLINAWNFMDGIDGLAATQAAFVVAVFAFAAGGPLAIHLGLALVAAICGFLPFNLPRARIFLGDVGSGSLGLSVALMLGLMLERMPAPTGWLAALPLSAFVLDTGLTLATRILRRERWWQPHVEHAYQRWARKAGSHLPVTAGYALWTLAGCFALVWGKEAAITGIAMLVSIWMVLGSVLWYWLRRSAVRDEMTEKGV